MLAAMILSLVFTFTYATWAAKSRRAEAILIPLLDILQSVPILGFISVTVVFFMSLAPGLAFGAECAAIFAIFTSQAWRSEEHTSELQSLMRISYAVFCLKKKTKQKYE